VANQVIVELKAVEFVLPVHKAQLLSYIRETGHHIGLLINFHARKLVDGVTRIVNDRYSVPSANSVLNT
jgi:GxxExxY protein